MKIIYNRPFIVIIFISLVIFSACTHKHANDIDVHDHTDSENVSNVDDQHEDVDSEDHSEGGIHLTMKQVETMDIQFGDFSQLKINDFVFATGTLGLPPNALTSVNAKANGFIQNSNKYVEGSYVRKGVIMAYLENPAFIDHQREYLEVMAELNFDRQELERQKALFEANAGIEKNVQKLQSEVNRKTATLKSLEKQLAYLNIDVDKLTPDNIIERIPIYSPMGGYITSIKMHNGMYVKPENELMEIVNENHLHLELDVFEKDIANIKAEQKISYTVPALGNQVYEGEVHIIGKEFNTENKTVRIHGHLDKERPTFIKDLFVEAKIWLNDQTVNALPEKALIQDGSGSFIYVTPDQKENEADEVEFEIIRVITGASEDGFTAIKLIDEIPEGYKIVTHGAYYVYAQSKVGELGHEH